MTLEEDFCPDATYHIGNTTIHIVAPKITEEERQKRLEEIKQLIIQLKWSNESKLNNEQDKQQKTISKQ